MEQFPNGQMNQNREKERALFEALSEGAHILGLSISPEGLGQLVVHYRLLEKWAAKINLTTVQEPRDLAESLYLDSAMLLPFLKTGDSLHDVGTGAGFPGLILKALNRDLLVTLTEAKRKKVSFLKAAAREMKLETGLCICWERLGDSKAVKELPKWKHLVSKAAFSKEEWLDKAAPYVENGGFVWVFLGKTPPPKPLPKFSIETLLEYRLPFSKKQRALASFKKLD